MIIVDSLETKIRLLETENKLLKDDIKNEQNLIDFILEHNSNLIQAQNVFAQKHSVTRKSNDKSINHATGNNAFRNKKRMSQTFQRMTDLKNFKLEDLIDHIKLAIRKSPDIAVSPIGANDLQNNCNIVKKANKLLSAVKEVDKNKPVKIAFSDIINHQDENFKDEINDVNNKLKKTTLIQQVWILLTIPILMDHV